MTPKDPIRKDVLTKEALPQDKQKRAVRRGSIFLALFLCLFQIFISFPVAAWKRNKFNLDAPLTHSLPVLAITLGAVILVAVIIALLIPRKIRLRSFVVLVVLAAALFIQQNFLSWNYGILDGQTLDFKRNTALGLIDIVLWVFAAGAAIFGAVIIRKQAANILLTVGMITLIMTGVNIVTYGPVDTQYALDERTKYEFSRTENVILFQFDAYQMDIFLELADTQPELVAPLEGFTVYENSAAVFAKTFPSIPLFLTGRRYQKEQPLQDFFKVVYDDSLLERMQKRGWDVGLYPNTIHFSTLINSINMNPKTMDNVIGGVPTSGKIDAYLRTLDLSLFRAVPHAFKPAIFNDGRFVAQREGLKKIFVSIIGETDVKQPFKYKKTHRHEDVTFRDLLEKHGQLATDEPAFKFFHTMVPHAPNWLDENVQSVKHDPTFEAYRNYSLAGLKLMGDYLDSLKKIGAYDNATIVIVSDHGLGTRNKRQYNAETKSYDEIDPYGLQRSAAKSLFLVKKPGDRYPLAFSKKPVSGLDVGPTLAAAAGIDIGRVEGQPVDQIAENAERTRMFNYYKFSTWDSKYLDAFEVFDITGDIRDDAAWTRIGIIKETAAFKNRKKYRIGEVLSYGADVKDDTDFHNAFVKVDDYVSNPNYLNAIKGALDLNIPLKKRLDPNDTILLQFEIYSGESIERKMIVNGFEQTLMIKPDRRVLNDGFLITPEMHKGQASFNLSFRPTGPEGAKPLHLSTVKLTVVEP